MEIRMRIPFIVPQRSLIDVYPGYATSTCSPAPPPSSSGYPCFRRHRC